MSYIDTFKHILLRDLKIVMRNRGDAINPLLFFIIVVTLFPLGVGPKPNMLAEIAPGIIWVAALLASLMSLERLFKNDYQDGSLEQMLLSPQPLGLIVIAKVFAHWLLTGLPLILISPLLALLMHLPNESYKALIISLAIGTPTLSMIGAIGAALTVGLKKGGVLLSLLILPLYIPILIFATSAIHSAGLALNYDGQLAILGAFMAASILLAPFAIGAALRVSTN